MTIPIVGEIPQITLYRFFSESSHAESFINKEIWFGWQEKYRNMESDIREDHTEGNAKYYVQVDNQTTVSFNTKTGEAHSTEYSRAIRTPIPRESGHPFHLNSDSDSRGNRTVVL